MVPEFDRQYNNNNMLIIIIIIIIIIIMLIIIILIIVTNLKEILRFYFQSLSMHLSKWNLTFH